MSWEDVEQEIGAAIYMLREDGETMVVRIIAEPVVAKGTYQKQEQKRILFPAIGSQGLGVVVANRQLAGAIAGYRNQLGERALKITRQGDKGNTKTTYLVNLASDDESQQIGEADVASDDIKDAFRDVAQKLDLGIESEL